MIRTYRWLTLLITILLLWLSTDITHAEPDLPIAPPFRAYYWQHEGIRTLGLVQSDLITQDGIATQYFEKGKIEYHPDILDPTWRVAYAHLTTRLVETAPTMSISGTGVAYSDLAIHSHTRRPAPQGFQGGTQRLAEGVFVPYDPLLRPAPGAIVPDMFWNYINRTDLFPSGWLHAVGLPLTDAFEAETVVAGEQRIITMQAFERTVLTYDPRKPAAWQVERANIGSDALLATGQTPLQRTPIPPGYVFPVQSADCSYAAYHHDYPATDIFCPTGSAVLAVTDGVVDFVSSQDRWNPATDRPEDRSGLAIAIIGDDGLRYYGSHLSAVAPDLAPGVRVHVGQEVGRLGNSGNARSTPPHLHFGISPPTTPEDWQTRRGIIPPYVFLRAWQNGEMRTPR